MRTFKVSIATASPPFVCRQALGKDAPTVRVLASHVEPFAPKIQAPLGGKSLSAMLHVYCLGQEQALYTQPRVKGITQAISQQVKA